MMKQKHLIRIWIWAILAMVLSQTACGTTDNSNDSTNGRGEKSAQAIPVETHILQKGEMVEKVKATGTVFPLHDVLVSSETAGTLTNIYVGVGDWVEKGAPLVQVDPELKQLALEQAEAKLVEAKAAYEKARRDFDRNKKLYESRDVSEYVFENARLQKETSESVYLISQAKVKMARRQLKDTRIVSPVNGFIAAKLVDLGSTVAPATPVAKVVDISQVKIKFGVPERDLVKISKGVPATILVDSYPHVTFKGAVSAVGPQADLTTRSFPVEILVKNSDYRLKAGMVARVEVAAKTLRDIILVPKSALLERSGQTLIFVIKNERAELRIPELRLEQGDYIALLDGAKAGEEVVILGQENLTQGVKVNVKKRHE